MAQSDLAEAKTSSISQAQTNASSIKTHDDRRYFAAIDTGTVTCRLLIARLDRAPQNLSDKLPDPAFDSVSQLEVQLVLSNDEADVVRQADYQIYRQTDCQVSAQGGCQADPQAPRQVYRQAPYRVHPLYRDMVICNLGEGVDATGQLKSSAIERVAAAYERFMQAVQKYEDLLDCDIPALAVATSAARDAQNSQEFLERVQQVVHEEHEASAVPDRCDRREGRERSDRRDRPEGREAAKPEKLDVRIISGDEEAALSFAGVSAAFVGQQVAVVDVGGGSTELVAGQAGENFQFAHSFNVGCRRVTERFLLSDPPQSSEIEAARAWLISELAPTLSEARRQNFFAGDLVAVAGTATTCVSVRESMKEYDSERVHGQKVSIEELSALLQRLAALPLCERERVVGLEPRRAPVIVAGLLILETVMKLVEKDCFTVSESDILQGIVLKFA